MNVIEASRLAGVRKIVAAGTTAVYSDEITLPMRRPISGVVLHTAPRRPMRIPSGPCWLNWRLTVHSTVSTSVI